MKEKTKVPIKGLPFVFVFLLLLLSSDPARAQTAVDYRFLELLDDLGRPVADANVVTNMSKQQSDQNGTVKDLPVYYGDYNTTSFKISKPGFFSLEGTELLHPPSRDEYLISSEYPQRDARRQIRIELLRVPVTAADQQAFNLATQKRELIQAAKQGDVAVLRRLLGAGVDANATDVNGIPAILWAATSGNGEALKVLLNKRATLRNKDRPGGKILMYYLQFTAGRACDEQLVKDLVKAGADVNAVALGSNVLSQARLCQNPQIIKFLEKAGAHSR